MINTLIKADSKYIINRARIRQTIKEFLSSTKVRGNVEVSLYIVGDRMMRLLNKKYRETDTTTDVLSFSFSEERLSSPFIDPPDDVLRLGDIVISYPQARDGAAEENKLVDIKIDELVIHAMKHLLGQHHE